MFIAYGKKQFIEHEQYGHRGGRIMFQVKDKNTAPNWPVNSCTAKTPAASEF
jgi:hypothetical protein